MNTISRVSYVMLAGMWLACAGSQGAQEQEHEHAGAPGEQIGTVHFQNSCDPAVAADFDRGVALLHSFWFPAAIDAFSTVARQDPSCGMAHWGIALSIWGNPFAGTKPPDTVRQGWEAAQAATAAGATTARERAYIEAAAQLFADREQRDHRTRTLAYESAMERLHDAYPEDPEAALFYALALNQTALLTDKTYANQLKAAAIIERVQVAQPDHPGVAHYLIHSYDSPALAERALDAARRYAQIAPAVPHALHMPSHTFTRVGSWEESIATNIASADAARKANSPGEVLHALDYQTYAYLQTAQDEAALRVVRDAEAVHESLMAVGGGYTNAGQFALAAIPARHALERGAWADAAALTVRPSAFPQVDAITHFARALGAARSGNPAAARSDAARLAELREALTQANEDYWAEQVEIQRRVAEAWITFAEGRRDQAVTLLRSAADLEDSTDKSAISPGPLAPARELLGEMLLEMNQPAAALVAFEATARKEPNRFRGVAGAARAAERAGDTAKARTYYTQLVEIAGKADTGRRELQQARDVLAGAAGGR